MTLKGKVAAILNPRELVINMGQEDGIERYMQFEVLDPGLDITDPDSGDWLGRYERVKVRVEIAEVHPRFSVARTYETYQIFDPSSYSQRVTRVKTIRAGEPEVYKEGSIYVSVGDSVMEMAETGESVSCRTKDAQ